MTSRNIVYIKNRAFIGIVCILLTAFIFQLGVGSSKDKRVQQPTNISQSYTGTETGHTIIVRGKQDFRDKVREALSEICPCVDLTASSSDGRSEIIVLKFPQDHEEFCKCYCKHVVGCNLLEDLVSSGDTTTIQKTSGGNSARGGTVRWNPRRRYGGRNADGHRRRPPSIGLAHELIHARHYNTGNLGSTRREEENTTVRGENQIRDEMDEPQRTHYGRRRVPNRGAGDPNLDATVRHGCECED